MARVRLRNVVIGSALLGLLLLNVASAVLALSYQRLANKMLAAATALDDASHPKRSHPRHDPHAPSQNLARRSPPSGPSSIGPRAQTPPPPLTPAPSFDAMASSCFVRAGFHQRGILEISPHELVVERAIVDEALAQQADMMQSTRILPIDQGGKVVGVRVFGIGPTTLLAHLGLRSGDTIETVNGRSISTPEKALAAYPLLQKETELTVHLTREGRPLDLRYHIR